MRTYYEKQKREERRYTYFLINLIVLGAAGSLFFFEYSKDIPEFIRIDFGPFLVLIGSVVLVHFLKAVRLYLALYGNDISFARVLGIYCKVTPVSVIFPLKLGEIFRMYCYGKGIGNGFKGAVIVLLDRFMDTLALVTVVLLSFVLRKGSLSFISYALVLFLAILLIVYYIFPGLYSFWKRFLLCARASKKSLHLLKMLETLYSVYGEIAEVARGRGALLYALSLIAWAIELGSVVLISDDVSKYGRRIVISEYLSSALGIGRSAELRQFVFYSVLLLIAFYIIIKLSENIRKVSRRK